MQKRLTSIENHPCFYDNYVVLNTIDLWSAGKLKNMQHITNYATYELKRGEFHPRDAGQLNFYLSAVDDLLKTPQDNPPIGLLLCEKKDRIIVEYATLWEYQNMNWVKPFPQQYGVVYHQ